MFALAALAAMTLTAEPPKLAVTSFTCSEEVRPDACEAYERRFLDRLTRGKSVAVTSQRDVIAAIGLERQKALLGCSDDNGAECLAELTDALGVDGILTGTITRTRSGYLLSIKVVRAKTGAQWASASDRAKSDGEVQDALDYIANRFMHELTGTKEVRLVRPVMFGIAGAGVVMTLVGGGLIAMAGGQAAVLRSDTPQTAMEIQATASAGNTFQTSGYLLATFGVPITVTALILALVDPGGDRMAIVPSFGPNGAFVSFAGRWP